MLRTLPGQSYLLSQVPHYRLLNIEDLLLRELGVQFTRSGHLGNLRAQDLVGTDRRVLEPLDDGLQDDGLVLGQVGEVVLLPELLVLLAVLPDLLVVPGELVLDVLLLLPHTEQDLGYLLLHLLLLLPATGLHSNIILTDRL